MSISLPAEIELVDARLAAKEAFRRYQVISLKGDQQATFKALADLHTSKQRVRQLG